MRDIAVTLVVLGLVPVILKYPWTGVLVYAWISVFNPHNWAFGFAQRIPFAMIIALATFASMASQWKEVRLPVNSITVLLMLLPCWMSVTLVFAINLADSYDRWIFVMKVFLFVLVAASLLHSKKHLEAFLWVIVASIGFYGIKGGLFTILSGGGEKVYGPPGTSYISDNNAISVALVMIVPLMQYLSTTVSTKWMRMGLYGAMFLSCIAVLGSQSRGAFLAIVMMVIFLWLKSKRKMFLGAVFLILIPIAIGVMSDRWSERMASTTKYDEDSSALGRLNAWAMAFNLANDRPLVGGGFEIYDAAVFARYAPDPTDVHAAHSIYFQMLGEHGYVGLALFLLIGIASWRTAGRTIKGSNGESDYAWAGNLARAIQVSLVGFAVGGTFVNIAYWEVVYFEIVILMAANQLVVPSMREPDEDKTRSKWNLAVTDRTGR